MSRLQEIAIEILDLTDQRGEARIIAELLAVPGVMRAEASALERRAIVTANISAATPENLKAAVARAGFTPAEIALPE